MNLTRHELSSLLKDFPNIELSYEKNIHKTVPSSNIYLTIPKGKNISLGLEIGKNTIYVFLWSWTTTAKIYKLFL